METGCMIYCIPVIYYLFSDPALRRVLLCSPAFCHVTLHWLLLCCILHYSTLFHYSCSYTIPLFLHYSTVPTLFHCILSLPKVILSLVLRCSIILSCTLLFSAALRTTVPYFVSLYSRTLCSTTSSCPLLHSITVCCQHLFILLLLFLLLL